MIDMIRKSLMLSLVLAASSLASTAPALLFATSAHAGVTVTADDGEGDASTDPSEEEDVRTNSKETCEELDGVDVRVSRC